MTTFHPELIGIVAGLALIAIDELWLEPFIVRRRIERTLRAVMLLSRRPGQRRQRPVGAGCSPTPAPTGTTHRDWS